MSRSSPEAVLHGCRIRIWVQRLWPLGNEESGHSEMQTEIRSAAPETRKKEPSKRRANVTWVLTHSYIHDNKMIITVKQSLASRHQNGPSTVSQNKNLAPNGARRELTTGSKLKRSSWNILMNMLKFFLLDEMFPNVCDKLCKLFSKQKTFNFTQHIPPWRGGRKKKKREMWHQER